MEATIPKPKQLTSDQEAKRNAAWLAFRKLAEVCEHLRPNKVTTVSDKKSLEELFPKAEEAMEIFGDEFAVLKEAVLHPGPDIPVIVTGTSRDSHKRVERMKKIIRELSLESENGRAKGEDIIHKAESLGMDMADARKALEALIRDSVVHEPTHGTYALSQAEGDLITQPAHDRGPTLEQIW